MLNEKLRKSEEPADGLHGWVDLQSNSCKKKVENLKKSNAFLRSKIAKLTATADSEGLKVRQKLQKKKENTTLQTRTIVRFRSTIQSLSTNFESFSSEVTILWKIRIDVEFMRDGHKTQKSLSAVQYSTLVQQLDDVQKQGDTI